MKKVLFTIAAFGIIAGSLSAQTVLIPNGGFEDADDSLTWIQAQGGGDIPPVTFDTGGNPDAHASLSPNEGWAVLVSPTLAGASGGGVPVGSLGLAAGDPVTFTLDMKNLNGGSTVGGMKVEAWGASAILGNTGDVRPALIGDGSTWESYTFDWTLPGGTDKLIFVPLWDLSGDALGIDNVGVVVPEPSTIAVLFGLMALGFVAIRRRR